MKRLAISLILSIALLWWLIPRVTAQDGEDDEAATRGAVLYAEFCQMCHGPQGEAVAEAPAFSVEISYDPDQTRARIAEGVDRNPDDSMAMPPYAQQHGGLLSESQIDDLMAYIATWETGSTPELPEPNIHAAVDEVPNYFGDPQLGAVVYAKNCNGCHGLEGEGRVPPNFPPFQFTDETMNVVQHGTDSPFMPGFAESEGGPLDEQELVNLETYMASWPPDEEVVDEVPAGVSTLVILMGIGSILLVGAAYWARPARKA